METTNPAFNPNRRQALKDVSFAERTSNLRGGALADARRPVRWLVAARSPVFDI